MFGGNDRPGVMLASAARTYVNRYAVRPGDHVVVLTNNDSAYAAALDLQARGRRRSTAVVDLRPDPAGALPQAAREAGIRIMPGTAVVATEGRLRITQARTAPIAPDGAIGTRRARAATAATCLLMSGGWNPTVHPVLAVARQAPLRRDGRRLRAGRAAPRRERSAGACQRCCDPRACSRRRVPRPGAAAARDAGFEAERRRDRRRRGAGAGAAAARLAAVPGRGKRAFVDFQNDVTAKDLGLAVREGFQLDRARQALHHRRHGRPTRARPSTSTRWRSSPLKRACAIEDVGTTTFRPPYTPVTFGAIAGPNRERAVRPGPHARRSTPGTPSTARCSRTWAPGSGRATSRAPARTCTPPSPASAAPCARGSASSTPPRSARSTSRAPMPPSSSTASTPTCSPASSPAAAATA